MRLLSTKSIEPGMKLARNLYGAKGILLLKGGMPLQPGYIQSMNKLGYVGSYVQDDLSSDIDIPDILSEEIRREAGEILRDMFGNVSMKQISVYSTKVSRLVGGVMDCVMRYRGLIINHYDLKVFDEYLIYHSINVTMLSIAIGSELGLNPDQLRDLGIAAFLHDLGNRDIEKSLLDKRGQLSPQEFDKVKKHTTITFDIMKNVLRTNTVAYVAAMQHHERFDGNGYPNKGKDTTLSLFGRIIAVADVFDAITSQRPYRDACTPSEAYEYIMANSGAHFDPTVVKVFLRKIAPYPVGSMVKLSNGYQALVVENTSNLMTRPVVRLVDGQGNKLADVNLATNREATNITIVGMV